MVGPGVVAVLTAQEKAKLTAWKQAFSRIPHKSSLQSVQGEPTTGVTCMETTYPSYTMSDSQAFRASLTSYDLAMEVVPLFLFFAYYPPPYFALSPSPLSSHPPLHFPPPPTSFSPLPVPPLSLISSSILSPPLYFSPFSLSLLSPSQHSFSP